MNAFFKKLTSVAAIVGVVTVGSLASASPAAAWGWGWRHGGGWGAPVAAGVLGALAVGAIAGAATAPAYYPAPPCRLVDRPATDAWGNVVGYRRVEVCG
jgi:hypothetical protein